MKRYPESLRLMLLMKLMKDFRYHNSKNAVFETTFWQNVLIKLVQKTLFTNFVESNKNNQIQIRTHSAVKTMVQNINI